MEGITTAVDLQLAIVALENKQKQEWVGIKEQLQDVYESTLPLNMIKNSIREVTASPELKKDILKTSINLLTVFLIKKMIGPAAYTPLAKVVESFVGTTVANRLVDHSGGIKLIGSFLMNKFFNNKKSNDESEIELT